MQTDNGDASQPIIALGVVLIAIGVGVAIWALTLLHTFLNEPESVPLVEQVLLGLEDDQDIIAITEDDEGLTFRGSNGMRRLVFGILALALFITLGNIISAFISGGAKVIKVGRAKSSGE